MHMSTINNYKWNLLLLPKVTQMYVSVVIHLLEGGIKKANPLFIDY